MRLRTLPLAFASIAMGSFLAAIPNKFNWEVFVLALLTTLFLQILSNLANDYGDTEHGADSDNRIGPARAVQSGVISSAAMRRAMVIFAVLSFISGVSLIVVGLSELSWSFWVGFVVLGLMAITAAVKYTAGSNPYGYRGLGDISVFLFFGLAGVCGTFFLHTHEWDWQIFLPASSMGFLATGVLNMNNMRDYVSDQQAGKNTIVVQMGFMNAKIYQTFLVLAAVANATIFTITNYASPFQFLYLLTLPLFIMHLTQVIKNQEPQKLDKQLKILVLSTLLFCLTFGIGLLINT